MPFMFCLTIFLVHILVNAKANEGKNVQLNWPSWEEESCELPNDCLRDFKYTSDLQHDAHNNRVKIQTDKCVYKSGDKINYRILFMDKYLKPTEPKKSAVIWYKTAQRNIPYTLEGFTAIEGVFTGQINIPKIAPTRYWQLGIRNGARFYKRVCLKIENIADNYKVKVEAPQSVSIRDGDMKVVVTANHVSGKPVDGNVTIALYFGTSDGDGPSINAATFNMIKGKGTFNMDVKKYADHITKRRRPTSMRIKATVVEKSTNVEIGGYNLSNIYPYRYFMKCVNYKACSTFKPDKKEDVLFQLSNVDDSSLNDTKSTVELIYKEAPAHYRWSSRPLKPATIMAPPISGNLIFTFEGHMNETGFVNFENVSLPALPVNKDYGHYYSLQLKYLDEQREIALTSVREDPKKNEE